MKVQVEFTAVLHVPLVTSGSWVTLSEAATVTDLLHQIGVAPRHMKYVSAAVNGRHVKHAHRLCEGDRVFLSLPMGGG